MARKKIIEIVLDTETTGLDYTKEKMVEFAAVRLENGKIKDEFQTLINPQQHIRKSSIAIHGITQDMVENAPTEEEVLPKKRTRRNSGNTNRYRKNGYLSASVYGLVFFLCSRCGHCNSFRNKLTKY